MQRVVEEHHIKGEVSVEIRPRQPHPPSVRAELRRLAVDLLGESRLVTIASRTERGLQAALDHLGVLFDPLAEEVASGEDDEGVGAVWLDVFCLPGVTDAEGECAALALGLASGVSDDLHCRSGKRYRFALPVPCGVRPAVERLLGNRLIHCFAWSDEAVGGPHPSLRLPRAGAKLRGPAEDTRLPACTLPASPLPRVGAQLPGPAEDTRGTRAAPKEVAADGSTAPASLHEGESVAFIELEGLQDEGLMRLGRELGLALDLAEMRAIVEHFRSLGRAPTDVEIQSLAQTWSEHCSHKTFKATIDFVHDDRHEVVHGLLPTYIMAPTARLNRPWVCSAFTDNAGVIAFDARHDLACKVETHNHPSALEPFGGAHTGVGGVIRDVLAVSAEPIANTDVLCFGPPDLLESDVPDGSFHPATTYREVVRGIADYGNNTGIPTVGGAILFHPGYVSNPLVYCGTLGIAPRGGHPRAPQPGDLVLVLGGRTGRDGLHGATMSSERLDRSTVEGTVVQIGNPITEKTLGDVLPRLRDEGLYHAITDCGAGGLCSAVGEMGESLGVEVDLECVPLKYPGLRPWEIWLSEAQERMVLAVPSAAVPRVFELCRAWDVEANVIGHFRNDGRLVIRFAGQVVAELDMAFLHRGRPARRLLARWETPTPVPYRSGTTDDAQASFLTLLRHPSIASKEEVIRQYDHEVGAATIVKPLAGDAGPSDAAVLKPLPRSWRGVVVAHGINPLYGALDPHAMASLAVDEALRNLVAVGGSVDRAALLDNFCWGDVDDPSELGGLVRAAQGCRDAALAYRVPFISGKDSLYNCSSHGGTGSSIPGTLLISAVGVIPDVRRTVSMDLKRAGSVLYLLGRTADELGGSHYLWTRGLSGGVVPCARPAETRRIMRRLTRAIRGGMVRSCHDLSEGGLAVAAAEMAIAGTLGLTLQLEGVPLAEPAEDVGDESLLFAESAGRFLVEVAPEDVDRFEQLFAGSPFAAIGVVTDHPQLVARNRDQTLLDLPVAEAAAAWRRA